jgi:hypothetical protein
MRAEFSKSRVPKSLTSASLHGCQMRLAIEPCDPGLLPSMFFPMLCARLRKGRSWGLCLRSHGSKRAECV